MKHTHLTCLLLALAACLVLPQHASAAFGLTSSTDFYTVDTGAGLVFKVRRTDNGSSTQSPGDIASLVYSGTEYQNQSKGSHINSGFDWLGYSNTSVNVGAQTVGTDYIKITVTAEHLVHYYIARNGYPHIYMATRFDVQPVTGGGLCRYIVRMPYGNLPNGPEPSDINGTTVTVESGDIFGFSDGVTRSKHYSNHRLIDWSCTGATGNGVGVFMVRDSQEGGSGGPFYRSLINQGGGDQEITYIINYGQTQTEPFRPGTLNGPYTLVFTDGRQPDTGIDYSFIESAGLDLAGWVSGSARGAISGTVSGIPDGFEAVVGFANGTAQYWARAEADGTYATPPMIPGTYTATLYKQELEVASGGVTVSAGHTNTLNMSSSEAHPSIIWRLGDRDGTPAGFMNADRATWMHPSDVRMDDWNLGAFMVGTSTPQTGIPCYQWKEIGGGGQDIRFNLTASQIVDTTVNVGITVAYSGGRPNLSVNGSWTSGFQAPSSQPGTRSLTTGSYRGNNTTYTFTVPASALQEGVNTLRVHPISGSGLSGFLSAGYSLDYIEWQGTPAALPVAPAGLAAGTGDTRVDLAWDPVPSATRYIVQRAAVVDGPYTTLSPNVGSARFSDTSVANGVAFFYRVSAVNAHGEGPYAERAATPSHLVTHYAFDETSGTRAVDSAGGSDGTLMPGASWASGRIGNAVRLDGSAEGYVELPDGLVQDPGNCTISTWANITSASTWSRIFDFGMGTESYMFLTPNSGDASVRFAASLASSGGEQMLNRSGALSSGTWHHLAVTLSGSTGRLYVDGGLADTRTVDLDPADLGLTRQNYIGKSQWDDPLPAATIDDFRIYNRALSSTEVATMASQATPAAPSGLTASAESNVVTLAWSPAGGAETYNVMRASAPGGPYTLLAGGLASTGLTFFSTLDGTNYFVVSASNVAGEGADSEEAHAVVVVPEPPEPAAVPLAYYRFDEGAPGTPVPPGGSAVVDSDGGDDNMNAFDAGAAPDYRVVVPTSTVPQTGQPNALSTYYDGSDDLYTALGGPLQTSNISNFTAEAYVRFTSLPGWQTILGRDDSWNATGGQDGHPQALFYLSKHGVENTFRVEVSTAGGDLLAVEGAVTASAGTWYHVAAVGDAEAGTLTLYVDGANDGGAPGFDGLFDPPENNAWTIGRGQYNGGLADHVSGYIDEVRITASALSPDRFLNVFNPDTDGDGLADAWELEHFGNLDQDGTNDPDGDGDPNEAEETNGTDPNISSIPPDLDLVLDAGTLTLIWPTHHTGWRLEYETNLAAGADWFPVPGSDTGNTFEVDAPADHAVFWRLAYP